MTLLASQAAAQLRAAPRARVVIVGAGFGGLEAARALRDADVDITLIDRRNTHLFQPLLYQVATAALPPSAIAWPIRSLFADQKNLKVLMAEICGVNTRSRTITDGSITLPYDYLILATGAQHSYFGHDEWAANAPGLKTLDDATTIRQRLLCAFEEAERGTGIERTEALLTMVVVGGGPTGVEMAGAIAELAHRTLPAEFRHIDPTKTRIVLIEAGSRLLAAFPEKLSGTARRSLESMQVEVRTNTSVTACDAGGVTLSDGSRIATANIVWAAGVRASPAAQWLGARQDRAGRVEVRPDLSVVNHPEIFAIGDTVSLTDAKDRPVPGVAPAAKQMGRHVGQLIAARVSGRAFRDAFIYKHQGDFATIGRKSAVAALSYMQVTGFLGWLLWGAAHIWFLIGLRSRAVVTFEWVWTFFTARRGSRLLPDRAGNGPLHLIRLDRHSGSTA